MSVWVREYDDGDWEIGLLDSKWAYGPLMENESSIPYFFHLDLNDWTYIGEFD